NQQPVRRLAVLVQPFSMIRGDENDRFRRIMAAGDLHQLADFPIDERNLAVVLPTLEAAAERLWRIVWPMRIEEMRPHEKGTRVCVRAAPLEPASVSGNRPVGTAPGLW